MQGIIFDYPSIIANKSLQVHEIACDIVPKLYWQGYRIFVVAFGCRYEDAHWLRNKLQDKRILSYFELVISSHDIDSSFLQLIEFSKINPKEILVCSASEMYLGRAKNTGFVSEKMTSISEIESFIPNYSSTLNHIKKYTIKQIEIETRHFSSPPNKNSDIIINGERYTINSIDQNVSQEDVASPNNRSLVTLSVVPTGLMRHKKFHRIINKKETCIALIYYKSNSSINYEDMFSHWFNYYSSSKTNLPIRIFGIESSPETILGCNVERVLKSPEGISLDDTTFSDCLRSQLYKHIQNKFVYLDLDCLILKPIDDIIETSNCSLSMCKSYYPLPEYFKTDKSNGDLWYNSGVIVFRKDCEKEFNDKFNIEEYNSLLDNPNYSDFTKRSYGQAAWSRVNNEIGDNIDSRWNCRDGSAVNSVIVHGQRGAALGYYKSENF